MNIRLISTLLAACVIAASAHAQALHPADRYDIKSEAEFAVRDATIKAGEPVAAQGGYIVPVIVADETCKVLVRPYTPKSNMEAPRRWKADTAVCGK